MGDYQLGGVLGQIVGFEGGSTGTSVVNCQHIFLSLHAIVLSISGTDPTRAMLSNLHRSYFPNESVQICKIFNNISAAHDQVIKC